MSYRGHVRIVNEIEYGGSISNNINDFEKAIEELTEKSGIELIFWKSEINDDVELDYNDFLEAYKYIDKIKENKLKELLKSIYNQAIKSESCQKNETIRIDWF